MMMMMIGGNCNQDFVLDCTKVAVLFVFQIKAFAVIWIDVWGFLAAAMVFGIYVLPSFPVRQQQGYIHIMFVLGCDLRWKTVLNQFEALNEDPRNKSLYVLLSKSQCLVVPSSVLSMMEARVSAIQLP
jgi:hypothetical protein